MTAVRGGALGGARDEPQHRRVQRIEPRGELRVPAVHGEGVLREIVGADREEIRHRRDTLGKHRRGGCLDHHTELDRRLPPELAHYLGEHGAHRFDLRHLADHRQ